MLEVELKFRGASPTALVTALHSLRAQERGTVEQVDEYFAHPSRSFAETDEALRIRRVGEWNFITYKGPKIDAATKTRREIELPLSSGAAAADQFSELLAALGFQPVAQVRKRRTSYHLMWRARAIEVALDEVDALGTFVEIETAADESDLGPARDAVTSLADELGLAATERRSYLEMLLALTKKMG